VPDKYAALYRGKVKSEALARYYGAVTCMDEAIGEIMTALRARGDAANTLVLFLSDNGGSGNDGNAPLRGAKGTMFEGGLRVPFLAWWPGRLPAGRVSDQFLTTLEILPTLAQVAGARLDPQITLDGFDLLPVLRGDRESSRTEMFWQRRGDLAARVGHWKWVRSEKGSGLFDLTADPGETRDLAATQPDVAQRLESRFRAWRAAMDATEARGPFRDY
jgi:arylsulfatase A-like enzyme